MISPKDFYDALTEKGVELFTGVPDSLLKDFCAYVTDNANFENNIITANEGGAVALAAGNYFATGKPGLVYMQNSGQGNAVNPLTSLADSEVYSVPMLLLIGWRGEPGIKDEPQHIKQGRITLSLLETLEIPYKILPNEIESARRDLDEAADYIVEKNSPYALIVKKGTFEEYELRNKVETSYAFNREQVLKIVVDSLGPKDIILSTTGKTSRELFEYREALGQKYGRPEHEKDFLNVGSMGHVSQVALGVALKKPGRQVYCFDGDGAAIMHLGGIATIGKWGPENYKHIIFNNGAHDSVGGQPTAGFDIDFPGIAKSCGYKFSLSVETEDEIQRGMKMLRDIKGPALLEIKINKGARKDLGRPTKTPIENKKDFMESLAGG